ncbi:hypothetical protein HG264_03555 [Pseudomonas sp. gcc21]|uniref:YciI family protein n=1 Tax=Pseudomonas sp. gcc21 TaxID=2726989 RepID=UPI0014514F42|nr:YciI family protein [Pseudomonas sp. gcc21]QJD58046.1 hypothetical protein HG264_03555 [Pseudomonas sp. gcc21]
MKFMLIRRADANTEKGIMPSEEMLNAMAEYNERMQRAGVFLTGDGLTRTSAGYRINFGDGVPTVAQGPFDENEVIAGYSVLQVDSTEEALERARQWPVQDNNGNVSLELRRYYELADFAPGAALNRHMDLEQQRLRRPQSLSLYLAFAGNCRDAFGFYADTLGGEIEAMLTFEETPMAADFPVETRDLIAHAQLRIGRYLIMGSDMAGDSCGQTSGGSTIALEYTDTTQGKQIFDQLAAGGSVQMPFEKTFWAEGFGTLTDRYGVSWMLNCGLINQPA